MKYVRRTMSNSSEQLVYIVLTLNQLNISSIYREISAKKKEENGISIQNQFNLVM